jgi:hypothetical protein
MIDLQGRNAGNLPFSRGKYPPLFRGLRLLWLVVEPRLFLRISHERDQPNRIPRQIHRHPFYLDQKQYILIIINILHTLYQPGFSDLFYVAFLMPSSQRTSNVNGRLPAGPAHPPASGR